MITPMDCLPTILLHAGYAVPLAACILVFLLRGVREVARPLAAAGFLVPALIALYVVGSFPDSELDAGGFAFVSEVPTGLGALGISLKMGLNGISLPLYLLAGIVGAAAGARALWAERERQGLFLALLLLMHGGLMGVFATRDVFFFYFFHELALIPTFIMISVWGGVNRRLAAMEMTVYLTVGAMLSLIGLIAVYVESGGSSFSIVALRAALMDGTVNAPVIFGLLLFGFGILVSLFPFHSWAPRGYAASPPETAMLHAGVLKKFGLYGLIQIAAPMLPSGAAYWQDVLVVLALGNVVLIGLVTMAQRDLKQMIGFSSVMHMGYAFLGIAAYSVLGAGGAVLMMVGHGLSVALLFMLASSIHRRTGTFDMLEMGGLAMKAPVLAGLFVAATMASIGLPGFANFWGELTVFVSVWQLAPWVAAATVLGIIISAVYGLRAVARIFFGQPAEGFEPTLAKVADIGWGERMPALILLAGLLALGLWPRMVSDELSASLEAAYAPALERMEQQAASADEDYAVELEVVEGEDGPSLKIKVDRK